MVDDDEVMSLLSLVKLYVEKGEIDVDETYRRRSFLYLLHLSGHPTTFDRVST